MKQLAWTWRALLVAAFVFAACGDDGEGARVFPNGSEAVSVPTNVFAGGLPTPTRIPASPTPSQLPELRTIYMEAIPFSLGAATGGSVRVRAFAFDDDDAPIDGVHLSFDYQPKQGTMDPISTVTRTVVEDGVELRGMAEVQLVYEPNEADPGRVTVTAAAGGVVGSVSFPILVVDFAQRAATVVTIPETTFCGADVGGTFGVHAVVLDPDHRPVPDIPVSFQTSLGTFLGSATASEDLNPFVATTDAFGNAWNTLRIDPGSAVCCPPVSAPCTITATAGGVTGTASFVVCPGRRCGPPPGPSDPGVPATLLLASSSRSLRVQGSGPAETADITAQVIDNRGNPLRNVPVRFRIDAESAARDSLLLPDSSAPIGTCHEASGTSRGCDDDSDCGPGICILSPLDRFVAFSNRAGIAQIQLRAGELLGPVVIVAEAPSSLPDEFTVPCEWPRTPGERCVTARYPLVAVKAGIPARLSLSISDTATSLLDGTAQALVSARVTDTAGNPVEPGSVVFFELLPFSGSCSVSGAPCDWHWECPAEEICENLDEPSWHTWPTAFGVTGDLAPCSEFEAPLKPGTALSCLTFPSRQSGTVVRIRARLAPGLETTEVLTLPVTADTPARRVIAIAEPARLVVNEVDGGASLLHVELLDEATFQPVQNARVRFVIDNPEDFPGVALADAETQTDENGIAAGTLIIPPNSPAGFIEVHVEGPAIGSVSLLGRHSVQVEVLLSVNVGGARPFRFVSSDPRLIGIRDSGLPERSTLAFQAVHDTGLPFEGATVRFFVNGTGGETLGPRETLTDAMGFAYTHLHSSYRAGPVVVSATVDLDNDGIGDLAAVATPITVEAAPPAAPPVSGRFTGTAAFSNIAARVTPTLENRLTFVLRDRFGNPPPAGTVVNFITNGASVLSGPVRPPTDENGRVTTTLIGEGGVPADGIVRVLAIARGEEPYADVNDNGVFDEGEPFTDITEPLIDASGNGRFDDHRDERFVDVNADGIWNDRQGPDEWNRDALIWTVVPVTFSGPTVVELLPQQFVLNGAQSFTLYVGDAEGNPLVGGSLVDVRLSGPGAAGVRLEGIEPPLRIEDMQTFGGLGLGRNFWTFRLVAESCEVLQAPEELAIEVVVTSEPSSEAPGGNGSRRLLFPGVKVPCLPATPNPTPTGISLLTPSLTATRTITRTVTRTRTITPTAALSATPTTAVTAAPTPTVDANPPQLRLSSAPVRAGEQGTVTATLRTVGRAIAGVENVIGFGAFVRIAARPNGRPDCSVNPDIDRSATSFAFQPNGCSGQACTALKAIVLSFDNRDPLPDGAQLYSCRIAVAADAVPGRYPLRVTEAGASSPDGVAVELTGVDGEVNVVAP